MQFALAGRWAGRHPVFHMVCMVGSRRRRSGAGLSVSSLASLLLAAGCTVPGPGATGDASDGVSSADDDSSDEDDEEGEASDAEDSDEESSSSTGESSSGDEDENGDEDDEDAATTLDIMSESEGEATTSTSETSASQSGEEGPDDSTESDEEAGEVGPDDSSEDVGPDPTFETLRDAAAAVGKQIGVAVSERALAGDSAYIDILAREFDYVTPENSAKWGPLMPSSTTYNWGDTDALVNFAQQRNQEVKGHTFVWHIQAPSWVNTSMSASQLNDALRRHIETTLERYRGRMRAWDVVNEAVDIATSSGYTESVFYTVLGPQYIENAFRWAREADPDILLIYNEVGIERAGPKSDFTYQMLRDLLERGVPIDGIGFQSHISTHRYPSESDLRANIRRFAELGLIVNISEVDARTKLLPGDQETRWHAQRIAFQQIVGSCTVEPACEAVTFWGFSDNYSWINDEGPEDPLIYDRGNIAKPAYDGVMDGLIGRLPVRGANAVSNADFSSGQTGWSASGGQLSVGAAQGRDGNAACLTGRGSDADGIVQNDLLGAVADGGPMSFAAWVRLSAAATIDAALLIEQSGAASQEFNIATNAAVPAGTWIELSGYLGLGFEGTPTAVSLKIDGPGSGIELCVADVRLQPLSIR